MTVAFGKQGFYNSYKLFFFPARIPNAYYSLRALARGVLTSTGLHVRCSQGHIAPSRLKIK